MLKIKFDSQIAVSNSETNPQEYLRGQIIGTESGLEGLVGERIQVWQDQCPTKLKELKGLMVEAIVDLGQRQQITEAGTKFTRLYDVDVLKTFSVDETRAARAEIMRAQYVRHQAGDVRVVQVAAAAAASQATPAEASF